MPWLHLLLLFVSAARGRGVHVVPAADTLGVAAEGTRATSSFSLDGPDTEVYSQMAVSAPPKSLHGKNLLLIGDSNDRKFIRFACHQFGAEVEFVMSMTCGSRKLSYDWLDSDQTMSQGAPRFCNLPAYNMSIMFFFHYGAMTTSPQPEWHYRELRDNFYEALPHLNTTTERAVSSADLVCFWREAVASHLVQRPTVYVTQSSVWDSVLGSAFLLDQGHDAEATEKWPQYGLQKYGWAPEGGLDTAWNWTQHVTTFLEAVRDGLGATKLYWRTTPNCPAHSANEFLNVCAREQADLVKRAIEAGKGIWSRVQLVDWRASFTASSEDCFGVHYKDNGYKAYIDVLFAAF